MDMNNLNARGWPWSVWNCRAAVVASAGGRARGRWMAAVGIGLCFLVVGCSQAVEGNDDGRPRVLTTATFITDMVAEIAGDRVHLEGLMGPGVDPHLYRPSASDLRRLNRADLIFHMGLYFEEQMARMLERQARQGRRVVAVTDGIPREKLLAAGDADGLYDPHVWFDASLWAQCVPVVVEALSIADPEGAELFRERGEAFRRRIEELHEWALDYVAELPEERRILVTSHDAFNYFGRAYGFRVVGLMGISTAGEVGLADMARMGDFIRENNISSIFVESSVSPRAMQRVSADSGARIGGELFSDSLGAPGELRYGLDVGAFDGMFRYNIKTIVEALR